MTDGPVTDDLGPRRARGPSVEELRRQARARTWRNVFIGALGAAVALVLASTGYTAYAIRQSQISNTPLLNDTHSAALAAKQTSDRVENCTTPGRACYERSKTQTGTAVGSINTISVLATACAVELIRRGDDGATSRQIAAQIEACVNDRVADASAAEKQRKSAPSKKKSSSKAAPSRSSKSGSPQKSPSSASPTAGPSSPPAAAPSPAPLLCVLGLCVP